jgi:hypothetical protein
LILEADPWDHLVEEESIRAIARVEGSGGVSGGNQLAFAVGGFASRRADLLSDFVGIL